MVSTLTGQKNKATDVFMAAVALLLVAASILGFYFYSSQSILLRVVAVLVAFGCAFALVLQTSWGQSAKTFWDESLNELRKVVWPTRSETMQSTIAVVAMVFIMGLLLWGMDAVIFRLVAFLVGRGV